MRLLTILSLIFILSTGFESLAQNPTRKSPDLIVLESEMREARYLASPTEVNKADLIKSYEALLPITCQASREKPTYFPERCQAALDKFRKVDEGNARLLCFENGFDSEECRTKSATLGVSSKESSYDQLKKLLDQPPQKPRYTKDEIQDPERERVRQLSDQILRLNLQYRKSQNPTERNQMLKLYSSLLPIVCKFIDGRPFEPSIECVSHREQALALDPTFPPALCFKEGPNSPNCRSIRGQKQSPSTTSTNKSQGSGGFVEF